MNNARQSTSSALFLVLIALVLFSPVGIDIYLPAVPDLIDYFNAEQYQVQNTITVFLLSMGLGQLIIGPLADHWGRRNIALIGIVLYGMSSWLTVFAESITELMWVRAIQGVAACCTSVAAFAVVRDCFSGQQSAIVYSYMLGAINLAPALAPILGSVLIALWGWQACFYALAIYALAVVMLVNHGLVETKPVFSEPIKHVLTNYWRIISHNGFQYYSCCCLAAMTMIIAYVTWSPVVLIKEAGFSQLAYAALFALNALWILITSVVAPRLIQKIGPHRCTQLGLLWMAIAGGLMLASYFFGWPLAVSLMLPVGIASVGFALILGSATSLALNPFAECAGTAAAMLGCVQMVGASLLVTAMTQLAIPPLVLLAAVMLLGGVPLLCYRYRNPTAMDAVVSSAG
ncbi:multidrug effflux MFS transporter [Endozoicomonas sp. SM1973]|uniref:Bcr/CflA family efflux transporter n=1 Tax=Spartinivicinus marinus TaxID=2994442 RepID=A0A853I742_9GAMM|nr:multidrug effflux MFS transporter [Spartinivicinus marinus]MCX4029828.1 multidrug effflux MFS transporter [Spartinivicinus marinus]NYZ67502.1 multidrug effflux MFS transporter [Spartinivicinus marinus]